MRGLLLLGLAAYLPAFAGRFQFDDFYLIVQSPTLGSWSAAWHSLPESLRPLTKLTLALNLAWHGLHPLGFHIVNVAIHLGAGVLLYRLLTRIPDVTGSTTPGGRAVAWLATAVFLLHPAQTDAVTYISGRSTSLMTACLLLSLSLALQTSPTARLDFVRRGAALTTFLAAVLAKEVALVYPVLYVIWLLAVERDTARKALIRAAPYAALSLALLVSAWLHPRYHAMVAESALRLPWPRAGLSQVRAVVELLGVMVFPWRVNIDHNLPAAQSVRDVWPHLVVLVGVCVATARIWRLAPLVAGGVLWGFAALLPTYSLLVRDGLMADRHLYLSMVGFSLAGAAGLARAWATLERALPRVAAAWPAVALTIAVALGLGTAQRNRLYRSEVALWRDSVAKAPENARAHHNLGYAYELAGHPEDAVREYRAAIALEPDNGRYWRSLDIVRRQIAPAGRAGP